MTDATPYLTKTPDPDLRSAMRDPFMIVPQVLDLVRLNGAIFFRSQFRSPCTPRRRSWSWRAPCRMLRAAWSCSTSWLRGTAGSP